MSDLEFVSPLDMAQETMGASPGKDEGTDSKEQDKIKMMMKVSGSIAGAGLHGASQDMYAS